MTYHYITAGSPGQFRYEVLWKGRLGNPVATCGNPRDAQRIVDALNGGTPSPASALEWIRVEDRMPDDCTMVLCHIAEDDLRMAYHSEDKWWDDDSILIKSGITHWCDPAPPSIVNQQSTINNQGAP